MDRAEGQPMPDLGDWGTFKLRIGTRGEWTYAVETSCNPNIDWFWYAADGESICGFNVGCPDMRHGNDPHRFDDQMAQAGLPARAGNARTAAVRFIHLAFGL